ncbi:hypothetical protein HK100_010176, partial [Physocladia obscura]
MFGDDDSDDTRGFNMAALFICFRESLEAVVTVVVMLQFVGKTLGGETPDDAETDETQEPGARERAQEIRTRLVLLDKLRRHIWTGALFGLLVAATVGFVVAALVHFLKKNIAAGPEAELVQSMFEC